MCWKLDRLARSLSQLLATAEDLERRGIGLRSITEDIRTDTPGGRLVFALFGALAQFERELIRERVAAGIAAAKAKGKLGGASLYRYFPKARTDAGRWAAPKMDRVPPVLAPVT